MKIGDIVEFKKTKNRYRIAGYGRMKDPKGNGWFDAVIYETYMDYDPDEDDYNRATTSNIYVREKDDFEEKFEFSTPKVQITVQKQVSLFMNLVCQKNFYQRILT